MRTRVIFAMAAALAAVAPASGAGLRTKFGEVVIRHIKIGQTYSLYKLVKLPLAVVNTGDAPVELLVDVVPVSSESLRSGYERIGALDWVRVETGRFDVAPSAEAVTDVQISLPNDPALLGRRFQADIWSRTRSGSGVMAVGLLSRLLIHVDSTPPTEEELKKKFVDESLGNLDFTILPVMADAGLVALGRTLDLKRERKISIKLVNTNERPLNFRLRSVPLWETVLQPIAGVEGAYDPKWLSFKKDIVKVAPSSIGEVGLRLKLPDEERVRGRKFLFVVSVEVLEQRIPTRAYYKLFVTAPAAAPEKAEAKP